MIRERMLARVFFTAALGVFLAAGTTHLKAQAEVIAPGEGGGGATCLDGNRNKCWEGPVDGGTGYKYWV